MCTENIMKQYMKILCPFTRSAQNDTFRDITGRVKYPLWVCMGYVKSMYDLSSFDHVGLNRKKS